MKSPKAPPVFVTFFRFSRGLRGLFGATAIYVFLSLFFPLVRVSHEVPQVPLASAILLHFLAFFRGTYFLSPLFPDRRLF
jgi:hypothetical protein